MNSESDRDPYIDTFMGILMFVKVIHVGIGALSSPYTTLSRGFGCRLLEPFCEP